MPWQLELLDRVHHYARDEQAVAELWIFGSAADPALLDRWSDLDLGIVLTDDLDLDPLIDSIGKIWTLDSSIGAADSTHRLIFTDGRRLDLVTADHAAIAQRGVRQVEVDPSTGSGNGATGSGNVPRFILSPPADADEVLQARFLAGLAAVKLGRGDYLIGTHLTLEFAQLCLIQAMVLRDRDEGKTSHRFGTHRDDLAEEMLRTTRRTVGQDWSDTLEELAGEFDRLRAEIDPNYRSDWSGLRALKEPPE